MSNAFIQSLADSADVHHVGGKAANLGKLIRAGFPVPGGFAITTEAYRHANASLAPEISKAILDAYHALGSPPVAVRSSATAEDMADASMAGQYETYLDIRGDEALLEAVKKCWDSINSPRIRAYLQEHGISPDRVAMAVAVQELIAADVAGVLFTANPNAPLGKARGEMLLEASWGLGEMVVSGRVQPDVLNLDAANGNVLSTVIADKRTQILAGTHDEQPVPEAKRRIACLGNAEIKRLWELGKKAAEHFGGPQDLEWAVRDGQVFLLQSRPITTLKEAEEAHRLIIKTREKLRDELTRKRGPWVVHNLGETLPHPTPLTWSILQPFMAGAGGFGEMYRQAGFRPAPAVEREGFLTLIAGRIYMDASRAPEMFFENFPFKYDVEELKRSPDASQNPPTIPTGTLGERFATGRKLAAVQDRLRSLSKEFDRQLRDSLFPSITRYVADAREVDLTKLTTEQLIERWLLVQDQVLDSLAPQLLLPSLISGMALGELRAFLAVHFWQDDPDALAQLLSSGGTPDHTLIADDELYAVGKGTRTLDAWLDDHGHRAAGEFDVAAPRWREEPDALMELATTMAAGDAPMERHKKHAAVVQARVSELRNHLGGAALAEFDRRLDLVRRYVTFREDSKDYLMLGYDLLRTIALDAGRRLHLGSDVFFLTQEEVFAALRAGTQDEQKQAALIDLILQRKLQYNAELRIDLPRVIDAPGVNRLGEPAAPVQREGGQSAFALSTGIAKGPARIVHSPLHAGNLGKGYILVCPSTDPSWTPLFVNAAGLVLECGGTLSHGAVVAREMGLPAVVVPDATKMFKDGEEIAIDATSGWVGPASALAAAKAETHADPNDTRIPHAQLPPPPGPKDRRAAKVRNVLAACWGVFLLAFFLAPANVVHDPTMRLIDTVLWPIVRAAGKPGTVVIVAAAIALITLLIQKFATDNDRLVEAKRRSAALQKQAAALPPDAPRRRALLAAGASVTARTLAAAMVPIGILLGPLVLPFVWFQQRVDPLVAAPPVGTQISIVATIDSAHKAPVEIKLPDGMKLDISRPASQSLPDLRAPLEHLLALYEFPDDKRAAAWEWNLRPETQPADTAKAAADLKAYLAAGIPPQGITWLVIPPDNFDGTFPVSISTSTSTTKAGEANDRTFTMKTYTVTFPVTLGTRDPRAPVIIEGPPNSPIKQLEVVYPANHAPFFSLGKFNISWLWVYILAYLPILLIARPLLKVA